MEKFTAKYGTWALVAGAAEGLGEAFSRVLAGRGMNPMRLRQSIRQHPVATILALVAVVAVTALGVRALSSQAADRQLLAASEPPAPASVNADSRYTPWQPGEYAPESEPTTDVVPALAPLPRPDAWSELSSLEIALGNDSEDKSRDMELPAPAGLDESMNPFGDGLTGSAASVETAFQGADGPGVRPRRGGGGMHGGVCR